MNALNRTVLRATLSRALVAALLTVPAVPLQAAGITIAIGSEPTTLDPQQRDDGAERAVTDNIFETLLARTPEGALEPGLAAEMPTQVDNLTWEFRLRPDVTFTNGEPLDAAAVVASVERIIDPEYNSEQMAYLGTIEGAEAVDELTVRVRTTQPDPVLPARMYWMKIVPATYSSDPGFGTSPVGTGPYMFSDWARGEGITLVRNEDYWGEAPAIDDVTYRFVSEAGTRLSGLMAGELDLIRNLYPEFAAAVPDAITAPGLETSTLVLSTANPVTQDPRVRKAMNLAIDRKALAESLFVGNALPAKGQLVNPRSFGFNESLPDYDYDPEGAKALIEEAGAAGKTITLVGESGRWLKDRELIEAVGAYWSEIGLNVDIRIEEFGTYLDQLFDKENRPDAIFVTNSDELLDADRPLTAALEYGASYASNEDEDMATKIRAARSETDVEARKALYAEITSKAFELDYLAPLLNQEDIYGLSDRLEWTPRIDAKLLVKEMSVAE
ncbi:ABC transporter substrate-binding protein [Celeribacter indicus]|uniref:Extracellular solute-binding protein n=1 Tax=Celeribacter indicus TaxID=1208324 RepID=A0A0B5E0D2_9RHOB|nr:ABC transporter substrate-binding protein [Celeribacter indicus]AJE46875.1 extracellular solute-binding protein [Celeribacter indicus]SDW79702.1 peptide/nickel transport system substrate-binding protein [Celeribacter indicus]